MINKSFRLQDHIGEKIEQVALAENIPQTQAVEKMIEHYQMAAPEKIGANCQQKNSELFVSSQNDITEKLDKLLENQKLLISLVDVGNKDSFISKEMLNSFLIEMEYEPFAFKTTTNDTTTHDWVHKANDIYNAKLNEAMKNKKLRGE